MENPFLGPLEHCQHFTDARLGIYGSLSVTQPSNYVRLSGASSCVLHDGEECVHRDQVPQSPPSGRHRQNGFKIKNIFIVNTFVTTTNTRIVIHHYHPKIINNNNSVSITTVKYITSMFISRQVVHKDTIPEVKDAYVNFLTHCYIDTEVDLDYLNSKDNPGVFTGGDERDLHIKSHVGSL